MQDHYGHQISYLRVSITDRCNERCTYCMPQELQEWLPRHEILTYEETLRLIRIAAGMGVSKVRITGGEPLTRRDVLGFFQQLPAIPGINDIGISTNGSLLSRCSRRPVGDAGAASNGFSHASHSEAATEELRPLLPARLQHRERLAPFAIQVEQHALPWIGLVQRVFKRRQARDLPAVHFRDHVFPLNILRGGQAVLGHVGHDHAPVDAKLETRGHFFRQLLHLESELVRRLLRLCRRRRFDLVRCL